MNDGAGTGLAEGKSSIRDFVDLEKMRVIFEKFTQATGFVVNFLDHPGMAPIMTSGRRALCSDFHKAFPASAELCLKSKCGILGCLDATGQLAIEVCGHGLAYCATPIIINGKHITDITAGQVLLAEPDLERFRNHAALYGFEEKKYLEALNEVPVEQAERLGGLTAFLGELVSVMAEQGLADAELKEKNEKLENLLILNAAAVAALKETEQAQRRLMKELESTNSEISQFNSLIAHDLQVPLRMVRGYSQLLQKRLAGKLEPEAAELLDCVLKGGSLMQKMLDDLMHYLREGANPEILGEVGMDNVLEQALCLLKGPLEDSGAEIARGPLPLVKADRAQMTHLLQNLIGNAIKFRGPCAPRIAVSCAEAGHEYVFTVSDNGIGIAPQFLERVFKIFQRLHTREEYPGTGVGLALCKKIVENHGGRIWAESGAGKGTAFHFSLPKHPPGFAVKECKDDAAE